jgi:hypothetical protein
MNILLEVSGRPDPIEFLFACAEAWMPIYKGDTRVWRDYGFGELWCLILSKIQAANSTVFGNGSPRKADLERILAYLVTEAIPEASQLEEASEDAGPWQQRHLTSILRNASYVIYAGCRWTTQEPAGFKLQNQRPPPLLASVSTPIRVQRPSAT